jgi:hypothetical protein
MIKFNVVINPFSQKILVSARVNKIACEELLDWNGELDSWYSFDMNGKQLIIHIHYEDELYVGVYDDNDDVISSSYPTTFKLTHKDEF